MLSSDLINSHSRVSDPGPIGPLVKILIHVTMFHMTFLHIPTWIMKRPVLFGICYWFSYDQIFHQIWYEPNGFSNDVAQLYVFLLKS